MEFHHGETRLLLQRTLMTIMLSIPGTALFLQTVPGFLSVHFRIQFYPWTCLPKQSALQLWQLDLKWIAEADRSWDAYFYGIFLQKRNNMSSIQGGLSLAQLFCSIWVDPDTIKQNSSVSRFDCFCPANRMRPGVAQMEFRDLHPGSNRRFL